MEVFSNNLINHSMQMVTVGIGKRGLCWVTEAISTLKIKNNPCKMTNIISFSIIAWLGISHEITEEEKAKKKNPNTNNRYSYFKRTKRHDVFQNSLWSSNYITCYVLSLNGLFFIVFLSCLLPWVLPEVGGIWIFH